MSRRVDEDGPKYLILPDDFMRLQDDGCPNCRGHLPPSEEWGRKKLFATTYRVTVEFDPIGLDVKTWNVITGHGSSNEPPTR